METITLGNKTLRIIQDNSSESPREWDNLGLIVAFHKRYNLGDKHDFSKNDFGSWDELRSAILKENGKGIILPVYMYEHSGVCLQTTPFQCPWDSGQVGFIYISNEKIKKEYGGKRVSKKTVDKVTQYLKNEVETYSQYLEGEVYGFEVVDEDDNVTDSCFGFYGSDPKVNGIADHLNLELRELLMKN